MLSCFCTKGVQLFRCFERKRADFPAPRLCLKVSKWACVCVDAPIVGFLYPLGRKGETLHALDPWHVVGLLATIALIIGVGIYSGRKVRSAADFASGGGKASGAWIVCGAIMGTLVSGQATIGTAQLAFNYGMSAWWFTWGRASAA